MCERKREMKIQVVEENIKRDRNPYGMALKKDWRGFLKYFEEDPEELLNYKTVNIEDYAIHIALTSENPKLVRHLLEKLPSASRLNALMQKNVYGVTALHNVALTNSKVCVELARELVQSLQRHDIQKALMSRTDLGETPIYWAAALGKTKLLQYLADNVDDLSAHFHRFDLVSVLHIAIMGQHFGTAVWLLRWDKSNELAKESTSKEDDGLTPLELLALSPSAFKSSTKPMNICKSIISSCLPMGLDDDYDYTNDKEDLETGKIHNGVHHPKKHTAISKIYVAIWRQMTGCALIGNIWQQKQKQEYAVELVKLLVEQDYSWMKKVERNEKDKERDTISLGLGKGSMIKETKLVDSSTGELVKLLVEQYNNSSKKKSYWEKKDADHKTTQSSMSEIPLIFAASNGITEIFQAILERHPEAVDYINDKGQNALHVAIMYRQKKILECIQKLEICVPKLATSKDINGYTILHHVANMEFYPAGTEGGPARQFLNELQWFKIVKDMMPSHYETHRDRWRKIIASDLFEETHADQHKKAQKWVKETAQSCTTLSILVATVVFAAAFTVPGGNNDYGFPHFLESPLFYVFTVMDVISLALSLSSVVMFLSILSSTFEPDDFLRSIPKKMSAGFFFLFVSVLTSMITFSAALLLVVHLGKKWIAILYATAIFPVIVLALMAFPFFARFVSGF